MTPGSLPRQAWTVLAALRGETASLARLRREIEATDPRFVGLASLDPEGTGRRVSGPAALPPAAPPTAKGEGLRLLATESLFGSEAIAAFSLFLDEVRPAPRVFLHLDDGARLGVTSGDTVLLSTEEGEAQATVHLTAAMAPGLAIVPRVRGSALEPFVPGVLREVRLRREGAP